MNFWMRLKSANVSSNLSVFGKLTVTLMVLFLVGCNITVYQSDGGTVRYSQLGGLGSFGRCQEGWAECSYNFDLPFPVSFTAQPNPGFRFMGWFGACSGEGSCQLTPQHPMAHAQNLRAEFLPESVASLLDSQSLDNTWIELCIGKAMVEQGVSTFEEVDSLSCKGPGYKEGPALESLAGIELLPNLVDLSIDKGACYVTVPSGFGCGYTPCQACPKDLELSDLSALNSLNQLESLSIRNSELDGLDSIVEQTSIQHITMFGVSINDLYVLNKFTALNSLDLGYTWDLDHYQQLGDLDQLTSLSLYSNALVLSVEDVAFPANLESLSLRHFNLTNLNGLAPSSNITELSLSPAFELASLEGLENFPNVESLRVGYANTDLYVEPILTLSNLSSLSFSANGSYDFYDTAFEVPGLRELKVMGLLAEIPPFVLNSSELEVLDLSVNHLTDVSLLDPLSFPDLVDLNLAANLLESVSSLESFAGSTLARLELSNTSNSERVIDCVELEGLVASLDSTSVEGGALTDCGL